MSFCLAGAGIAVQIAASAFTLGWTHTVEKTAWQEAWAVENGGLRLVEAKIQGSGAGMDPPPEARLEDGYYVWAPTVPPLPEVILRRGRQAGDWRLCADGRCATIGEWLGRDADPVRLGPPAADGTCEPAAMP